MPPATASKPKECAMIFSGESVKAILEGRKSMTRRVVKPQPKYECVGLSPRTDGKYFSWQGHYGGEEQEFSCPYGRVGDEIWVREKCIQIGHERTVRGMYRWPKLNDEDGRRWFDGRCHYAADLKPNDPAWDEPHGTLSPLFMPRWASRLTLVITEVRVERVQEISEADAQAEGCELERTRCEDWPVGYRNDFIRRWDALNSKRNGGTYAWEKNCWVWVVSFATSHPQGHAASRDRSRQKQNGAEQ